MDILRDIVTLLAILAGGSALLFIYAVWVSIYKK